MNHCELFAGIGGFAKGLEHFGFETTLLSDNDQLVEWFLRKTYPDVAFVPDVHDVHAEPGEFDIVTGGFPCQPFSKANRGRKKEEDVRYLWPEMKRVILEAEAPLFIGENVRTFLATVSQSEEVRNSFVEMTDKYDILFLAITASAVYAPHRRERVYILGRHKGHVVPYTDQYLSPTWAGGYTEQTFSLSTSRSLGLLGNAVVPRVVERVFSILTQPDRSLEAIRDNYEWHPDTTFEVSSLIDPLPFIMIHGPKTGLSTPTSSDQLGSSDKGQRIGTLANYLRAVARADGISKDIKNTIYPNPDYIEWLMGFPKGYVTRYVR